MTFIKKLIEHCSFDVHLGGAETNKDELNKMLKDAKNKEYLDVIYFGLAELLTTEKKLSEAIPHVLSVSKSLKTMLKKPCQVLFCRHLL